MCLRIYSHGTQRVSLLSNKFLCERITVINCVAEKVLLRGVSSKKLVKLNHEISLSFMKYKNYYEHSKMF